MPYYLENGSKVFIGFAANGKYIAPEGVSEYVMQNTKSFTDIAGHWAAKNGIIAGYGNGFFGPNDSITREQMAAILYRFAGFLGVLPDNMDTS